MFASLSFSILKFKHLSCKESSSFYSEGYLLVELTQLKVNWAQFLERVTKEDERHWSLLNPSVWSLCVGYTDHTRWEDFWAEDTDNKLKSVWDRGEQSWISPLRRFYILGVKLVLLSSRIYCITAVATV